MLSLDRRRRRVLIVEDDAGQAKLMTLRLTAAGFEVRHVDDPSRALSVAESFAPDALVSDVLMPMLDGFELCRALRRHPALSGVPIVLYSSVASPVEAAAVARRSGATGFVSRTPDCRPLIDLLVRTLDDEHAPTPAASPVDIDAGRSKLFAGDLRRHVQRADALANATRDLTESLELDTVTARILERATTLLEAKAASLWDLDVAGPPPGESVAMQSIERGRAVWVDDVLAAPLRVHGRVLGALTISMPEGRVFAPADATLIERFADQAALALANARLFADSERSREVLRQSEARHRAIVDGSIQGMLIHRNDRILFANAAGARLIGCERAEDLIGTSVLAMVVPEDRERMAGYERARRESALHAAPYELRVARRDGQVIWVEGLISNIDWEGQRAVLATLVDVSERKRSEEALRQTEEQVRQLQRLEAVGQLAGGVAHDFNNLLTVIIGRAEMLAKYAAPDTPAGRCVEAIHSTAASASELTKQLLAFSRKQVLEPRVLDLGAVVTGMHPMLRRLIGEDIEITTSTGPDVGRVMVDPAQAEQVLMNLAVNARDAMPRGGRLSFHLSNAEIDAAALRLHIDAPPGRYVLLEVSDTGIGMDAATRARVFEPFFTTKAPGKGTGLGLATVFGVVKQSGGHVQVYSELGHGSTFKVYFPRVDAAPDAPKATTETCPAAGGSETVLVVEDDPVIRDLILEILTEGGYRPLTVETAPEALALAESYDGPIDLLLTDVIMPTMSGRDVAEGVGRARPGVPVLYISGYTDDVISRSGLLDGDVKLLMKPFAIDTLLRRVRETIDAA